MAALAEPFEEGPTTPSPTVQPAKPYVDLTSFVDSAELEALDLYLREQGIGPYFEQQHAEGRMSVFPADGLKYASAVELCDRDTSGWCLDVFHAFNGRDDFKQCRAHRGDPNTWRPNANSHVLPGVVDFVKRLPFFEATGKIAIIVNNPNDTGVEHSDIGLDDLGQYSFRVLGANSLADASTRLRPTPLLSPPSLRVRMGPHGVVEEALLCQAPRDRREALCRAGGCAPRPGGCIFRRPSEAWDRAGG